jgi:transcriptional regulator with XRE-family HTH domain
MGGGYAYGLLSFGQPCSPIHGSFDVEEYHRAKHDRKVGEIIGVSQATINRYELDVGMPMHEKLLRYAEHFDVSLDYIYGRTDNPQGTLFDYEPDSLKEQFSDREQLERFIEFCFEPGSPGNEKLKTVFADMLGGGQSKPKSG